MFKSFIVEGTSLEKKVQKLIKKNGYAEFNNGQGRLLHVSEIDDGVGYGMTNDDEDEYVDLSGDSQRWFLEGTVASDVAQSTGKLEKKILRKPLDDEEDEDNITEASDNVTEALMDAAIDGGIAVLGSFEDRDVMTRDAGFEMNYKNKVYQVTITQSR